MRPQKLTKGKTLRWIKMRRMTVGSSKMRALPHQILRKSGVGLRSLAVAHMPMHSLK